MGIIHFINYLGWIPGENQFNVMYFDKGMAQGVRISELSDVDKAQTFIDDNNGKHSLYVTVNPMDSPSAKIKPRIDEMPDLAKNIYIDIDADKPTGDDKAPATYDDIIVLQRPIKAIEADLIKQGVRYHRDFTGNGYRILIPVDGIEDDHRKGYIDHLHKTYGNIIDRGIKDRARVTGLPGTLNIRGEQRPGEGRLFRDRNKFEPKKRIESDGHLFDAYHEIHDASSTSHTIQPTSATRYTINEAMDIDDRTGDGRLRKFMSGDLCDCGSDRSQAESQLAHKLRRYHFGVDEIADILITSLIGKAAKRDRKYAVVTAQKACDRVTEFYEPQDWGDNEPSDAAMDFFTYTAKGDVKGVDVRAYANHLITEYHVIVVKTGLQIYYYSDGIYRMDSKGDMMKALGVTMFGDFMNEKASRELVHQITHTHAIWVDVVGGKVPRNLICMNNGIYDTIKRELLPHTPGIQFISKIATDYDPIAVCPDIEKAMLNIFGDMVDEEYEWLGYCLTTGNWMEILTFYINTGSGGRTTYFNMVRALFGDQNVSEVSIHEFSTDINAAFDLIGKQINIRADIGRHKIRDFEKIKELIGRDKIRVQQKYIASHTIMNNAKMMFAANEAPIITDASEGAGRRIRIMTTIGKFRQGDEGFDRHIIDKLTTPKELSGLINHAIAGLARLIERGNFESVAKNAEDNIQKWSLMSKPIYHFVEDCVEITGIADDEVRTDDLYDVYKEWLVENGLSTTTAQTFIKMFGDKMRTEGVTKKRRRTKGVAGNSQRYYAFCGLHLT